LLHIDLEKKNQCKEHGSKFKLKELSKMSKGLAVRERIGVESIIDTKDADQWFLSPFCISRVNRKINLI